MEKPKNEQPKILIIDNDRHYIGIIQDMLDSIGLPNHHAASYEGGVDAFQSFRPAVCLINIEPIASKKRGIKLAKWIRQEGHQTIIIFLSSAFNNENYELAKLVQPSSFMSKEISPLVLRQAIELAIADNKGNSSSDQDIFVEAPIISKSLSPQNNFFFKVGKSFKAINVSEVAFFYAEKKLTYGRVGNRNFPTNVQLKSLEEALAPIFLRCHKKYLVNVNSIISIMTKEDKVVVGDEVLPIGYAYRKRFLGSLNLLK